MDIHIEFQPCLRAQRGRLLSGTPDRGTAVHAATFIRQRRIVLESELLRNSLKLKLILVHEIFHFAWARLGNRSRQEFSRLLAAEFDSHARGELGESADVRKALLQPRDRLTQSHRWREYVCESFCDSAAWLYSGIRDHPDFKLGSRWCSRRRDYLLATFEVPRAC
ncbi:MAG: hypothetical protein M3Y72_22320 [Acidobacteriota bacterium]|nr:hypothetical protein [Acidobacteriota bacterium]